MKPQLLIFVVQVAIGLLYVFAGTATAAEHTWEPQYFTSLRDAQGRFLEGSLEQLNRVLGDLELKFSLDNVVVDPVEGSIDLVVLVFFIRLIPIISPKTSLFPNGRQAVCKNIQISGDLSLGSAPDVITGEDTRFDEFGNCVDSKLLTCGDYKSSQYLLESEGDDTYYNRYNISVDGFDVSLLCNLDVDVIATGVRSAESDYDDDTFVDLNMVQNWLVDTSVYGNDRFVEITATGASLGETITAFSEDFTALPPSKARITQCSASVGTLAYVAQNVVMLDLDKANNDPALDADPSTAAALLRTGLGIYCAVPGACDNPIDLTEQVEIQLSQRPELVKEAVEPELCALLKNLSEGITSILVDNPLVNASSDLIISNPFEPVNGRIPALEFQEELNATLPPGVELFDLTEPNFVIDLLFPNDTETIQGGSTIIGSVLQFFVDFNNETDPVLGFVSQALGFNLTEQGDIENLDILQLIQDLGNITEDAFTFNISVQPSETVSIDINITILEAFLDLDAPDDEPVLADPDVLSGQTLIFPSLRLGDIEINGSFALEVFLENTGDPESSFLASPFVIRLDETIDLLFGWDNFFAQVAALFALNLDSLLSLNFGPLIEAVFDCLFSSFHATPRVTGAIINADAIRLQLTGNDDTLTYLVTELVNIIVPIYQPVIPDLAEFFFAEQITNRELLEPTECELADEAGRNELYNFDQGIFKTVSDLATAELLETVIGFIDDPDNKIQVLPNELTFSFDLPTQNGFAQTANIALEKIFIEGIVPPEINEVALLSVRNGTEFYPQGIFNKLDLGSVARFIRFQVEFSANLTSPVKVDPSSTAAPGPLQIAQTNQIIVQIAFSRILAILDLYAHYTRFAVESMEVRSLIDVNCWLGRLNESGGVKELSGLLESPLVASVLPFVTIGCNCPRNRLLQDLASSLSMESTWGVLLDDINFLITTLGEAVELQFNEDNLNETITNAGLRCAGLPVVSEGPEFSPESKEDLGEPAVFIGMVFGALSATTILACSSRMYKKRKGIKRGHMITSFTEDDFETDVDYEGVSIFKSSLVPIFMRFGVPAVLLVNIVLFVVGDTGDAAIIAVEAEALGVPFGLDEFENLSVISSVLKLWEGGAYLLAFMLFMLSIFFPYFKLFCLGSCWFVPPKYLPLRLRGRIIWFLDTVGKWSFVEFFFLIFVLVAFKIRGTSPELAYFPESPLLKAELIIEPQISLFTFGLAVVISLIIGNVCLIYHEKIINAKRLAWRREKIEEIETQRKVALAGKEHFYVDEDKLEVALYRWEFTGIPDSENNAARYFYQMTYFGLVTIGIATVLLFILLTLAGALEAILLSNFGVVAYLIEFSGQETIYSLSAFDLIRALYRTAITPITVLLSLVFVATITIIPLMMLVISSVMVMKELNLARARQIQEARHILYSWCCVDVFVFAIAFTCLEVGVISRSLVKSIPQCVAVGEFMTETLLPLGIVDEENANASCFALEASLQRGAYVALFAVLVFNIFQYYIAYIFGNYLEDRSRVETSVLDNPTQFQFIQAQPSAWHKLLSTLQLMRLTRGQFETSAKLVASRHEGEPEVQSFNPMFAKNSAIEAARKNQEDAKRTNEQMEQYEMLHPRNKLLYDLRVFFRRVDPSREHMAEALVEEAFSRPGGLQRLNEKLMDKYGATVAIQI